MAVKFNRIFNEEFPSIKSPDPLIMWSCKFTKIFYLLHHDYQKAYGH